MCIHSLAPTLPLSLTGSLCLLLVVRKRRSSAAGPPLWVLACLHCVSGHPSQLCPHVARLCTSQHELSLCPLPPSTVPTNGIFILRVQAVCHLPRAHLTVLQSP